MGKISEREISKSFLNSMNNSQNERIENITGSLNSLNTNDKSNLVNAINEVITNVNTSLEGKPNKDVATESTDGLMSASDKTKLNNIQEGANKYIHPDNSEVRHVTDAEKANWNSKASTDLATNQKNGLLSSLDKSKLDGIEDNANNYIHPSTHHANMIIQDSNNRFVSDSEKTKWDDKYTKSEIDNKISSLLSNLDWKESVDSFSDISYMYPNPVDGWTVNTKDTDETWRYNGTDWVLISANNIPVATPSVDGKMSSSDKAKLDTVQEGANNYIHPGTGTNPHGTTKEDVGLGNVNNWGASSDKAHNSTTTYATTNMVAQVRAEKANVSHGNHIPAPQSANPKMFLRNDNTWQNLPTASISETGIVQLNDSVDSTSTTQAATANAVKKAYDLANQALAGQGDYIPTPEVADKSKFLRNDNTWQKVEPDNIGAARGTSITGTLQSSSANWYRIAKTMLGIDNSLGQFHITTVTPGKHSSSIIHAGITYGLYPSIQQLSHTRYSGYGITKVRLVYHTSYENNYAYIEVYVPDSTSRTIKAQLLSNDGWILMTPTIGSIPSGYTSKELQLVEGKIVSDIVGSVNGYTISKSVPADAKFTDTVYTHPGTGTNPHGTTKSDVGLGNVNNWGASSDKAHNSTTTYATTNMVAQVRAEKANVSHGNHVPTTEPADPRKFLRNDNTWQSLPNGSTSVSGIVQLNDATNSTSTLQAATANAVKKAYDLAASKANASHGNHVPATQTANNKVFLRNDNTWQTITPANIGAADRTHSHDYLPLSGGTLTGPIKYSGGGYNGNVIMFKNVDANGAAIGIGAGAATVIGSGDNVSTVMTSIDCAQEILYNVSDYGIKFITNLNSGYDSRVESEIDANGNLIMAGSVTVNKKVKMLYNSSSESLDFIFV